MDSSPKEKAMVDLIHSCFSHVVAIRKDLDLLASFDSSLPVSISRHDLNDVLNDLCDLRRLIDEL